MNIDHINMEGIDDIIAIKFLYFRLPLIKITKFNPKNSSHGAFSLKTPIVTLNKHKYITPIMRGFLIKIINNIKTIQNPIETLSKKF